MKASLGSRGQPMLSPGWEAARGGLCRPVSASGPAFWRFLCQLLPASLGSTRLRSAPHTGQTTSSRQKPLVLHTTGQGRAVGPTPWDAEGPRRRTGIRPQVCPSPLSDYVKTPTMHGTSKVTRELHRKIRVSRFLFPQGRIWAFWNLRCNI